MSVPQVSGQLHESKSLRLLELDDKTVDPLYLPLVERLRDMRQSRGATLVVAIAGISKGAGTSQVAQRLAQQLESFTIEPATYFMPSAVHADGDGLARVGVSNVWELQRFIRTSSYVVIDCPPIEDSAMCAMIARRCDALFVVVEAGRTSRRQIQGAVTSLSLNSVPVAGFILNKRRYFIPNVVFRWL